MNLSKLKLLIVDKASVLCNSSKLAALQTYIRIEEITEKYSKNHFHASVSQPKRFFQELNLP